jgi:hypothetical protein
VAAAESAGESAMFKGMIEVEASIIASSVVPDPGAVVMDVRGLRMACIIVKTGRRVGNRSTSSGWTMLRNESAAHGVAAAMGAVLRQGGQREHQGYGNQGQRNSKKFGD